MHVELNFTKWKDNVPCILIKVNNGWIMSQCMLRRILQNGRTMSKCFYANVSKWEDNVLRHFVEKLQNGRIMSLCA